MELIETSLKNSMRWMKIMLKIQGYSLKNSMKPVETCGKFNGTHWENSMELMKNSMRIIEEFNEATETIKANSLIHSIGINENSKTPTWEIQWKLSWRQRFNPTYQNSGMWVQPPTSELSAACSGSRSLVSSTSQREIPRLMETRKENWPRGQKTTIIM